MYFAYKMLNIPFHYYLDCKLLLLHNFQWENMGKLIRGQFYAPSLILVQINQWKGIHATWLCCCTIWSSSWLMWIKIIYFHIWMTARLECHKHHALNVYIHKCTIVLKIRTWVFDMKFMSNHWSQSKWEKKKEKRCEKMRYLELILWYT